MNVADCMTPEPVCLAPEDTLSGAIALMEAGDFRAVPITLNGKLIGIISERDIRLCRQEPEATKVSEIMSRDPICVSPDDSVNEAVRMILSYKIGGLPVVKEDNLVGMITTSDILNAILGFPALDCGCPEFVDTRVRWILDHGFVNNLLRHARVRSAVPQYAQQRAGGPRASEALASARACWPGVRIHGETSSRGLNAAAGGCRTVRYIRTPRCGREFEYSTSSDGPVRL